MTKMTLTCDHGDGYAITHQFEKECLPDVVAALDTFLRGCGFVFDGCLTIEAPEPTSLKAEYERNKYYFDFDRNR